MSYAELLGRKEVRAESSGLLSAPALAGHLFPFQAHCVEFGLRAGSWGCFLDTGLGKTACELEWCKHAAEASNGRALILTPLAVARQIEAEGRRWGYPARVIRDQSEAADGINICNYDRLDRLEMDAFGAIALDESAILKNFTGATSRALIAACSAHRWRLSASATPAPNDHVEIGTHSSFCGVMAQDQMLIRWFLHDSNDTGTWRLKGHARRAFFDWMASWSRMAAHPRDLGDDRVGFDLPRLSIVRHFVDSGENAWFADAVSATTMHDLKRKTTKARVELIAELVAQEAAESWVIWCDTDYEADALRVAIADAVEVRGSHPVERKEEGLDAFRTGAARAIITKPSIAGHGLNWQHCARMAFVGRSFSYESWYQAVRRCWRFGQQREVIVHLAVAEGEDQIGRVIDRKAADHNAMRAAMTEAMLRDSGQRLARGAYEAKHVGRLPGWMR